MSAPADRTGLAEPMRHARAARLLAVVAGAVIVAVFVLSPLLLHYHKPETPKALTAGRVVGMAALSLLLMQLILSGRVRWLDRAFGLDVLYRVHAVVGTTAVILVSAHPLLIAWPKDFSTSLAAGTFEDEWGILLGAATLTIGWAVVITAVWRVFLNLPFHVWRKIHYLTFVLISAALVHAFAVGGDLDHLGWGLIVGIVAAAMFAAGFAWAKILRPLRLRHRSMEIRSITRPSHDTVNVEMVPPAEHRFAYLPGQFSFVRFASKAVSAEEHPFTLSSSPTAGEAISMTIKDSGDWTGTVGRLRAGERARIHGPFGRFSHLIRTPADAPIALIAGGVGITPLLSMLRTMADTQDPRRVVLIWSNRTEKDILFREEIDSLQGRMPALTVHHVLTRQEDWPGPTGRLDGDMLERLLAGEDRRGHVFLCGPPAMTEALTADARKLGYRRRRIHTERFALA